MISFRDEPNYKVINDEMKLADVLKDEVHPNDEGYYIISLQMCIYE